MLQGAPFFVRLAKRSYLRARNAEQKVDMAVAICNHGPGCAGTKPHNRGDGTFEEVSKKAEWTIPGIGSGWQALWAISKTTAGRIFTLPTIPAPQSLPQQSTTERLKTLVCCRIGADGEGRLHASMGVDVADFDHSGRYSIIVTNFSQEARRFFTIGVRRGLTISAPRPGSCSHLSLCGLGHSVL